jgi:hypothetical protein
MVYYMRRSDFIIDLKGHYRRSSKLSLKCLCNETLQAKWHKLILYVLIKPE